jgi:hypothetical protein
MRVPMAEATDRGHGDPRAEVHDRQAHGADPLHLAAPLRQSAAPEGASRRDRDSAEDPDLDDSAALNGAELSEGGTVIRVSHRAWH